MNRLSRQLPILLLVLTFVSSGLLAGDLDRSIAEVESLREATFERPVERRELARKDLRAWLQSHLEEGLPLKAEDYVEVLRVLGLIRSTDGAIDQLLDLYEAQILAFYDPVRHVYYAIDGPLPEMSMDGPMKEAVVIHELTHALQDQRFDAGARMESLRGDWDGQLAWQSLLEGEATLVMFLSLGRKMGLPEDADTIGTLVETLGSVDDATVGIPEDVPAYFVASLEFPYLQGLRFVAEAYRRGGWKAVDRIFQSPPATSREILHPELYYDDRDEPAAPSLEVEDSSAVPLLSTSLGEFHWRFLLGREVAEGWRSDRVRVIRRGDGAMNVQIDAVWSDAQGAKSFAEALAERVRSGGGSPSVALEGSRVRVIYDVAAVPAPSLITAGGRR